VTGTSLKWQAHTQAEGWVNLDMVVIKCLQALVYWVKDCQKHGLAITANAFTAQAMEEAGRIKEVWKELKGKEEPQAKDLGIFDPDTFESHEDAFLNLLAQTYGAKGESLQYVVCDENPLDKFDTNEQEWMFQIALNGEVYETDNWSVYHKLKAFLVDTPGWVWIKPFDATEDGCGAYTTWCDHYNGHGELSKRTALTKAKLNQLFYKNEKSMTFERYLEQLRLCFQTLARDPEEK